MIIALPKDIVQIHTGKSKSGVKAFRFKPDLFRMIIPSEIVAMFPGLGIDLFVSPGEKCLYLSFNTKNLTQFQVNSRNGYVGCKKLFEWAVNAETPIFDNYRYDNYQIDRKNRIVKVKLERK